MSALEPQKPSEWKQVREWLGWVAAAYLLFTCWMISLASPDEYAMGFADGVAQEQAKETERAQTLRGMGLCRWADMMSTSPICQLPGAKP